MEPVRYGGQVTKGVTIVTSIIASFQEEIRTVYVRSSRKFGEELATDRLPAGQSPIHGAVVPVRMASSRSPSEMICPNRDLLWLIMGARLWHQQLF